MLKDSALVNHRFLFPCRVGRVLLFLGVLGSVFGCVRAARSEGDSFSGQFVVEQPRDWVVVRNQRFLGNGLLVMRAPDDSATITIEWMREGRATRALPLRLVSDTLAVNLGRKQGVEAEFLGQHQIEVDGWEAWVTTAVRRSGPHARMVSVVAIRIEGRIALITLHTLPGGVSASMQAWQRVLESFTVPDQRPPEFLMEDLILTPPEEWSEPQGG